MITGSPLLQWKELRDFPDEFEARDVKSLYAAKRACQAFLNRIHRDLQRMSEE